MIVRDWVGEVAYIFAGGPSLLTQPFDMLRDRRRIVINSSYMRAPDADILFFHDDRWWREYGAAVLLNFKGAIYTTMSTRHPRVTRLRNSRPGVSPLRQKPLTLSDDLGAVPMRRTSVVPALNIAMLKGACAIVLLGLDGKFGDDGKRNHYAKQYKWKHLDKTWELHQEDLAPLVPQLENRGILVVNASPESAFSLWPIMTLQEAIVESERHICNTYPESSCCDTNTSAEIPQASEAK